ncbi:MAG TPA: TrpB-like pyridoxal phosphate-dependent enzyme [Solirubrobacteraceae bacterium]|nr:TrpB-like pyridoxal phosphate-dependent enzyme [Solirubrobacteraceae bacterium]
MSDATTKYLLTEDRIPTHWVNVMADLPGEPLPPLNPQTKEPAGPPDLLAIFPESLVLQEVSAEPEIEIPEEVREAYKLWRPTPLYRARRLERALGTPAHIYYKYEGVSPSGSHKPNTAIPQAYENARAGIRKITTETGAGQWGSSLAFACGMFGLECEVFMVGSSYDQKPYRRSMMETWGATVHRSPSQLTDSGRANARHDTGSLGIAISEAVEIAAQNEDINYALGSVLNHVLLHQTVIGQETIAQMEMAGEEPDVVIACVGGGSNFGGLVGPWLRRNLRDGATTRFIGAEPAACPTLTKGVYAYDYGDTAGFTPLMPMYTLGHDFVPPPVHAGGLRYHGDSPLVSALVHNGLVEARAYRQSETFAAGVQFARTEGIIPAPEPTHAIRAVIDEAQAAKEAGEERVILFGLCGHGHFDLSAYDAYLAGTLEDPEFSQDDMDRAIANLPEGVPAI